MSSLKYWKSRQNDRLQVYRHFEDLEVNSERNSHLIVIFIWNRSFQSGNLTLCLSSQASDVLVHKFLILIEPLVPWKIDRQPVIFHRQIYPPFLAYSDEKPTNCVVSSRSNSFESQWSSDIINKLITRILSLRFSRSRERISLVPLFSENYESDRWNNCPDQFLIHQPLKLSNCQFFHILNFRLSSIFLINPCIPLEFPKIWEIISWSLSTADGSGSLLIQNVNDV
jgi:hypothetical protein